MHKKGDNLSRVPPFVSPKGICLIHLVVYFIGVYKLTFLSKHGIEHIICVLFILYNIIVLYLFMNLKEFLKLNPVIQQAELANLMYPNTKSARTKLSNKLNNKVVGSGTQRILRKDEQDAKRALEIVRDRINEFIEQS